MSDPELPEDPPELDDFLAAPEGTLKNERERQKLIDRKAQDAARRARENFRKQTGVASHEDLLADLVRVAEDEATNPFHKHRSVSERRYELYGHYPLEELLKLGQFSHVCQQAGLRRPEGDRRLLRARTLRSLQEHDERYMRRYLLPHVQKFPELHRAPAGWKCVVVISDMHGMYLDPFTWHTAVEVATHLGADCFYMNGDVIDGNAISSHPKVPGSNVPPQLEFDLIRGLGIDARNRLPDSCRLVWGAGNHFLDRMVRFLTQNSGLAGLRSLRIDQLVGLDDLDIELVQGGTFVSPKGTEEDEPRTVLWENYMVTHGTRLGQYPAAAELRQWGMSGTSGHVHRASIHYGATYNDRGLSWMSTPMACVEDAGRNYIKDFAGWQKGFGVAYISPKGNVRQQVVLTDGGEAYCEGTVYTRPDDCPQMAKGLKSYWMNRFGLDPSDYI